MCSLSPLCVTPSLHTNMSFYNPRLSRGSISARYTADAHFPIY